MKKLIVRPNGTVRVQSVMLQGSKTQQHHKDECDINNIVAKYRQTGQFTHLTQKNGVYADVSKITDYHESLNKVQDAQAAFAALPSNVRLRFNNDPAQLLAFMQDPTNHDEGVELGIYNKPPIPPNSSLSTAAPPIRNESNESKNSRQKTPKETQLPLSDAD